MCDYLLLGFGIKVHSPKDTPMRMMIFGMRIQMPNCGISALPLPFTYPI
jgi:hypothetical protein